MEFNHILRVASEQQGLSAMPKRYSLAVGPPKKDPKVKGVQSAAVRAFLKRQEEEQKNKVLEEKRRKEELLAKRVELKHDRKARAMASRTKDNFCGYNGIPVEEKPKKRQGRGSSFDRSPEGVEHMTGDEMEQYEYGQTESEHELEEHEEKPAKASVKPKAPLKSAPPAMNFNDLLKLAEKKQYEPVEIKVVKKTEERPMTAEELREREFLERKNRKGVAVKEKRVEKEMKPIIASSSSKKEILQKALKNAKLGRHSADKHTLSKGSLPSHSGGDKKPKGPELIEKQSKLSSSSKPNHIEKVKPSATKGYLKNPKSSSESKLVSSEGGRLGPSSHTQVLKRTPNGTVKQPPANEPNLKKMANSMKPANVASSQHENVKNSISKPVSSSSATGVPLSQTKSSSRTGPGRPNSSLVTGHGSKIMAPGQTGNRSGLGQQSSSSNVASGRPGSTSGTVSGRPASSSGPGRSASNQSVGPGRPSCSLNTGLGRSSTLGSGPGRPSSASLGTLKPKCTVVSETISSKNLVSRPSSTQMNGMRPFPQQRPGISPQGFPRPSLPPITYKRQYEDDDEYDSEMEDFIDDEGEPQEEISKHIREIFGYDRNRYKDESDYALRYMESSWKEQQKEEAKSLRLGMQEDLEELRREEEELKQKKQTKKLRTH
ncbi:protein SPT2 homolog [Anolis carolinensis]|uniref:Protein SPT2 homolog n=1 Tax=Anolis carolinensis TaxID=28377 RepID=G1K891_ANOCA|nr:PREDICTED: protein SPT2 homolog [Anolis carolinensis]|eukprot:XP_003214859.1 PREDICTED: protein SPT2 homolog [Anolis carolinensis]